ncbi:hypothetical protein Tco_1208257 [Tanacetum coccineum]
MLDNGGCSFNLEFKGHMKRDCLMKKSSGSIRKGKHDQDSNSSDDKGNAYFVEALVNIHYQGIGKVKIQLHAGSSFILEDIWYVPGLRRSLISLGTIEKEGYTLKMQMGKVKVIKGCRAMMSGIRKKNRVYTLEANVITFGVQKHGGSKQVGFKQIGHKQVEFKELGPGVKIGVHGVHTEIRVWFKVELRLLRKVTMMM